MPLIRNNTTFNDHITHIGHQPFPGIVAALDAKRTPFRKNMFFAYNPSFLAAMEWNRCVDFYLDKTPQGTMVDLFNVMQTIKEDEFDHKQELENLAEEIIREMYNIPDDIKLNSEISTPSGQDLIGDEQDEEEQEELTEEQKFKLEPFIQKRILLNSLIHGAGVHQWVSSFYIGYEKLNEINPNLIEHYNSYASLINYFNWQHPMALMSEEMFNMMYNIGQNRQQNNQNNAQEEQEMGLTQGYNQVDLKNQTINAVGINFPVLLHELSKGALEYLFSRGIPEDLNEQELNYLYSESDKYSHEYWHYYMGPTMWRALIDAADLETQELPKFLAVISTMEYEELSDLLFSIVYDLNDKGKQTITKIKNQIK